MYYFAYASNLNLKQMQERCPDSKLMFRAVLPNYKLIFAGWSRKWRSGVATIKPSRDEKVFGAVYEISDRCLRVLDGYEGYPAVYDHLNVLVIKEDGEALQTVTFVKREQSEETQPSQEYVAVIRQGYRDWGIT
ncbi:gamma-glutamylcyclotransferase family protein [Chloroflexota bacterium]